MGEFDEFAATIPDKPKPVQSVSIGDWDVQKSVDLVREVISHGGLSVMRESEKGGSLYFHLKECVFDSSHVNNDAAIQIRSDGSIGYHCFHDSCSNREWSDVRSMILPKKEFVPHAPKKQIKTEIKKQPLVQESLSGSIEKFYSTGLTGGMLTGWEDLDNYYTVLPGQWTLVTGIPSHGKSSWLDALTVNLSRLHGWKFAVFSPENHPVAYHASKLTEIVTGGSFFGTFRMPRMTQGEMSAGAKIVENVFTFISHENDILTLDGILERSQKIVDEKGVNGLVIDPWNEIDHVLGSDTETLYISKALTKIRLFARNNNIHVWVVAHPTKMQKNDQGTYNPPTPYDVAGGAHWRNKSDCSITVHRPTFDRGDFRVDIHVQKIRFKHVGKVGKVTLEYNLDNGQYNTTY